MKIYFPRRLRTAFIGFYALVFTKPLVDIFVFL